MSGLRLLLLLVAAACVVSPAAAQNAGSDDAASEAARLLFAEGLEFVEAGDFERAAEKFRAALELRRAPAIEYNLASSLYELDRPQESMPLVESVLANPETPPTVRPHAVALRDRLVDRLGRVDLQLRGQTTGVRVTFDDEEVPREALSEPRWVLPGEHVAVAFRDDDEVARSEVDVAAGGSATATLDVGVEEDGDSIFARWELWAIVGAAVVVVLTTTIVVLAASGPEDPIQGDFQPGVITWP